MPPRLLTTQEAAERLGLTPGSLQELRWKDDGLPIFQNGLSVHYRQEDLEAFEQRELRTLLKQVLQRERPLPLIRAIARSLDLAVNTQGVESNPEVFKPAERQDLKPAPKVIYMTAKGRGCVETHLRACGYIRGYSAGTLVQRASHLVVDMPIGEGVVALLHGHLQPAEAAAALMGRESWGESV